MAEKDFFQKVFIVCRQIPKGKITTYGTIAQAIGSPQSARMIGWALHKSFSLEHPINAHRVLNRHGMLSGKKAFGSPTIMQQLLESEGHIVRNDTLIGFEKALWIPDNLIE